MSRTKNKIKERFSHYLPLIGIYSFVLIAFLKFSYEKSILVGAAVGLGIAYIAWGIVHHIIHKDLDSEVVFEYVTVAALGLILLITLIHRM